jgi:hypothetical protein
LRLNSASSSKNVRKTFDNIRAEIWGRLGRGQYEANPARMVSGRGLGAGANRRRSAQRLSSMSMPWWRGIRLVHRICHARCLPAGVRTARGPPRLCQVIARRSSPGGRLAPEEALQQRDRSASLAPHRRFSRVSLALHSEGSKNSYMDQCTVRATAPFGGVGATGGKADSQRCSYPSVSAMAFRRAAWSPALSVPNWRRTSACSSVAKTGLTAEGLMRPAARRWPS